MVSVQEKRHQKRRKALQKEKRHRKRRKALQEEKHRMKNEMFKEATTTTSSVSFTCPRVVASFDRE